MSAGSLAHSPGRPHPCDTRAGGCHYRPRRETLPYEVLPVLKISADRGHRPRGGVRDAMITKFDSSYYGTADMENLGYAGTPINERCYSKEELAEGDAQGGGLRQVHGRARLQHLLDGRASFPARGHGIDPEPPDDGDASVRRDQEPQDRLRLQHRADVASAAPRPKTTRWPTS